MDLARKYRPKKLEQLIGQDTAVEIINAWIREKSFPHAILLSGPSGCGKTTIARILKRILNCVKTDFTEINCADFRGIDTVREIRRNVRLEALGDSRLWLIDEAHKLSDDAQTALLKTLEEPPKQAYLILATTHPTKLIRTIRTRCAEIPVESLLPEHIEEILKHVCKSENKKIHSDVRESIVTAANGSARDALMMLTKIIDLENRDSQMKALKTATGETDCINICKLLTNPAATWPQMAAVLKTCDLADPEGLRHLVLRWAQTCLLSAGRLTARAAFIIEVFGENLYDAKQAGFVARCYAVVSLRFKS